MIPSLLFAVYIAQATPPPYAQNVAPVPLAQAPMNVPPIAGIDRTFAAVAADGNYAEMQLAKLALVRSTVPEVRGFAEKMIAEHGDLMRDMEPALKRELGGSLPQTLPPPDQLAYKHLDSIAEVDFDQEYLTGQIADHVTTLTAFETEADNGTDPELKMLAKKWIPTIKAHLEIARNLTQHVGGSSPFKTGQ
jgi:putative membrane protein